MISEMTAFPVVYIKKPSRQKAGWFIKNLTI